MQEHLDEEENVLIPMLQQFFTQESFDKVTMKILDQFPIMGLLWEIPPFLYYYDFWCTPKHLCPPNSKELLMQKVPTPILFLSQWFMQPRWMSALQDLHAIETGTGYVGYSELPNMMELVVIMVVVSVIVLLVSGLRKCLCASSPPIPKEKKA